MRCKAALLPLLLMMAASSLAQDCLYKYVQQPQSTISCNPHGSELQLHCIVTGPLSPPFEIKWYSTSATSPGHLTPLSHSYNIKSLIMDVTMGISMRSISSVLQTGIIDNNQTDVCFLCRAEISGLPLPVTTNSLCIHDPLSYDGLPQCRDSLMVNTTSQCVPMTESFKTQLQQMTASPSPTPSSSSSLTAASSANQKSSGGSASLGSTLPLANVNTASSSKESLPTNPPVVMETTLLTLTSTPTPDSVETQTKSGTDEMGLEMADSPSNFQAGLYAAIVVCVIFVIVILVLVVVIVCLSRRKGKCFGWRMNTQHKNSSETRGVGVGNRVFMTGSEIQSLVESGTYRITQGDNNINEPRLIIPPLNDHEMPTQQILNKRSPPRGNEKTERLVVDQTPPNLPPKPGKLVGPSKKGLSTNYDHLELLDDSKRSKRSPERAHKEPPTLDESTARSPDLPPKKPPRSRSKDHFYHTLESSEESGLLHSANTSHQSSRISSRLSQPDDDEPDYSQPHPHRSSGLSEQLKELFDDPRYAVLFVNLKEENAGLSDRREICRSTPSLVQLMKPGVPERRSLRTPHKRISVLPDPLHYHSKC